MSAAAFSLSAFTADTRLFDLEFADASYALLVESWVGKEALSELYEFQVTCLANSPLAELQSLLGKQVSLLIRQTDGSQQARSGYVRSAAYLGEDGGFARYRLTLAPWLWFATQRRHSRVFQDQSVLDILTAVFAADAERASWRIAPEVEGFLANARPRSYCCQYRESDYDFVTRLLTEEGLGFYFEEVAPNSAPSHHRLVLFADSTQFPDDASSSSAGIRFHRNAATEQSDSIQGFHAHRTLQAATTTISSWDYKAKRVTTTSRETSHDFAANDAPHVESYDWSGVYAFATQDEADHYARIARDAADARFKHWFGNGSVRTFRPGTAFVLLASTLDQGIELGLQQEGERRYSLMGVLHAGINNLPTRQAQPHSYSNDLDSLKSDWLDVSAWDSLLAQARSTGYANRFTAIRNDIRWRPASDANGLLFNHKPTARGSQTAIVVGPDGSTADAGTVHTDHLGRIRLRFHWQQEDNNTCWVRVAQLFAGPGYGAQFIPRIGQEVLVKFLDNDIDRPIVTGVLYNGQGDSTASSFSAAADHAPAGQGNQIGNGASPAWHGAAGEHAHAGYLSGFKSVALGADGHSRDANQLVFDDTSGQLRTQLATDTAATQLNLGHLIHQADNYRGSYRGSGWEMRTDAYGAVRAGKGILLTTYHGTTPDHLSDPAGDNTAGIALIKQAQGFAATFNRAAAIHQTVQFILVKGGTLNGQNSQSRIDSNKPPIDAMVQALSGMIDAGDGTPIPHMTQPLVVVTAQAGIGVAASEAIHIAAGEAVHFASGRDTHLAAGDSLTLHSGQAIGLLAGTVKPGDDNMGLSLIAGQGDIDMQAQSNTFTLAAHDLLQILSTHSHIDLAAANSITLATEGGASMTIEGGNITFACPGTISIKAGSQAFEGPTSQSAPLPEFPSASGGSSLRWQALSPETGKPAIGMSYQIIKEGEVVKQGELGNDGRTERHFSDEWGESIKVLLGSGEWSSYGVDRITPNEHGRIEIASLGSKEEGKEID